MKICHIKMTRLNPQIIHGHMSYTIKEIMALLKKSEKTCLRWIAEGLTTVPGQKKPMLILGNELKTFIRARNSKKKVRLKRDEFYCFHCKAPRRAKRGTISQTCDTKRGECSVCNGKMIKKIKPYRKDYPIPSTPVQMSTLFDNIT